MSQTTLTRLPIAANTPAHDMPARLSTTRFRTRQPFHAAERPRLRTVKDFCHLHETSIGNSSV